MVIRAATRDDATAIHDLHARSVKDLWLSHYSEAQIDGWMAGRTPEGYVPAISRGELFVAEGDSGLLGFGHATNDSVEAIFVNPDVAGTGVGTALLRHALAEIRKHGGGSVRLTSTLNAVSFYRRFGFRVMGKRSVEKGRVSIPVVDMELPVQPN
jgi:ribosomal protein S18 acetylase RimI-like enzyme